MKVFSGSASKVLALHIAKLLNQEISPLDIFTFPDGERRIRIVERVVDEHCIVVQSACPPVDLNYMELFFIIDGLKRSGASSVTAIVPYFGYQRQDHIFRDGEAVSMEVIIKIIESIGVDRFISVDLHASRIPDLFHIPVVHLSALPLFAKVIVEKRWNNAESVLISPDMGGIRRIKIISQLLNDMPWAALEKNRDLDKGSIAGDAVREGSVTGKKRALIIDDMISSGKTVALASNVLKKLGIKDCYVFATHPVFSEETEDILNSAPVQKVYVKDTVTILKDISSKKIDVISVAGVLASEVKKIF